VDLVCAVIGAIGGELSFGRALSLGDKLSFGHELSLAGELSLGGELSLFLFLSVLVVDDRSAVVGSMIYMRLKSFPARVQEDGEVREHFLF
jgi:hypothetical protein